MITDQDLARIKAYCEKATPGKWTASYLPYEGICVIGDGKVLDNNDDMKFIAQSRTDLHALVEEVERLKVELNELEKKLLNADANASKLIVRAVDAEEELERLKTAKDDNRSK